MKTGFIYRTADGVIVSRVSAPEDQIAGNIPDDCAFMATDEEDIDSYRIDITAQPRLVRRVPIPFVVSHPNHQVSVGEVFEISGIPVGTTAVFPEFDTVLIDDGVLRLTFDIAIEEGYQIIFLSPLHFPSMILVFPI